MHALERATAKRAVARKHTACAAGPPMRPPQGSIALSMHQRRVRWPYRGAAGVRRSWESTIWPLQDFHADQSESSLPGSPGPPHGPRAGTLRPSDAQYSLVVHGLPDHHLVGLGNGCLGSNPRNGAGLHGESHWSRPWGRMECGVCGMCGEKWRKEARARYLRATLPSVCRVPLYRSARQPL